MASVGEISDHSDLDEVCDDHYDGSGGYDYSSGDGSPDNDGDNHEDDGSPDNDGDNDGTHMHYCTDPISSTLIGLQLQAIDCHLDHI